MKTTDSNVPASFTFTSVAAPRTNERPSQSPEALVFAFTSVATPKSGK